MKLCYQQVGKGKNAILGGSQELFLQCKYLDLHKYNRYNLHKKHMFQCFVDGLLANSWVGQKMSSNSTMTPVCSWWQ